MAFRTRRWREKSPADCALVGADEYGFLAAEVEAGPYAFREAEGGRGVFEVVLELGDAVT